MKSVVQSQTTPELKAKLLSTLQDIFGLGNFRPKQLAIMTDVINGHDILTLLPTGSGKSLCYQLPTVMLNDLSVVISPLLSLIQDQIEFLKHKNIPCAFLNSQTNHEERLNLFEDLRQEHPQCRLLYTTPETLIANHNLQTLLKKLQQRKIFSRVIIDEAHCVSNWGHDFRDSYLELKCIKQHFPGIQIVSLTATATPKVQMDIIKQLGMKKVRIHRQFFIRGNLSYQVEKRSRRVVNDMAELIQDRYHNQSGIVYCLSQQNCEDVADELQQLGISAHHFHAGLPTETKTQVQKDWLDDQIKVMVATIAFGMGINKPNVRFVFHYSMPKSIEGYYQEIGRAGRDGQPADCILFYSGQDKHRWESIINNSDNNNDTNPPTTNLALLESMSQYCKNRVDCQKAQLCHYLGEYIDFRCRDQPEINSNQWCSNCRNWRHQSQPDTYTLQNISVFNQEMQKREEWERTELLHKLMELLPLELHDATRLLTKLVVRGHFKPSVKQGELIDIYQWCNPLTGSVIIDRVDITPITNFIKVKASTSTSTRRKSSGLVLGSVSVVPSSISGLHRLEMQAMKQRLINYQQEIGIGILPSQVIDEICAKPPQSHLDLLQLSGFDAQKIFLYGDQILALVKEKLLD